MIATTFEIQDESWAAALESALGPLRYALSVAEPDEARAVDVARQHDFPGPIVVDVLDQAISAGPFAMNAGAPLWLAAWARELRLVEADVPPKGKLVVTTVGVRRDQYGVWVSAAPDRVLGRAAVRAQLEAARLRLGGLIGDIKSVDAACGGADRAVNELEERVARQQRRAALEREIAGLPEVRAQLKRATEDERKHKDTRSAAVQKTRKTQEALTRAEAELKSVRGELGEKQTERNGMQSALSQGERRYSELVPQVERFAEALRPEYRKLAEAGSLPTEQLAQRDVERAEEALKSFEKEGVPDPSIRDERDALARNMSELEAHIQDRQQEADAARGEVDRCRGDYIEVIRSTLHDYGRRARALAGIASATLEIDLPKLENTDRSLDEAGIVVRIGFDGKPPIDVGDSSHSGGQQVINAFILLMSMAETEGEGFFIVDEPFAHLSIDRIDEVGMFLRRSGSQFLITVPTTLDRAQLDPASLVIVLRKKKKKPGDAYAPLPLVGRA